MIGTSRLDPEKRVCLSAVSDKEPTTSSATNDGANTNAEDQQWTTVTSKKNKAETIKEAMAEMDDFVIERFNFQHQLTGALLQHELRNPTLETIVKPSLIKKKLKPKPPQDNPHSGKNFGVGGGFEYEETPLSKSLKSWADVVAEPTEKNNTVKEVNPKHAERKRRTFIVRRAPFGYTPEQVILALDEQFRQELGEVGELLETVTRDKYDRRRIYLTFKRYEDKQTVATKGFRLGNVTIPGEPGDAVGFIPDVPHYLDLDDLKDLLKPYGTVIRHRFRTYANTNINKGSYDFDIQLNPDKQLPNELQIYNDTMTVLDKNQRKHCTHCNRYGHLNTYCRTRLAMELRRKQETTSKTTTVDDSGVAAGNGDRDGGEVVVETVDVVEAVTAPEANAEGTVAAGSDAGTATVVETEVAQESDIEMEDENGVDDENLTERDETDDEYETEYLSTDDGMVPMYKDGKQVGMRYIDNDECDVPYQTRHRKRTTEEETNVAKKKVKRRTKKKEVSKMEQTKKNEEEEERLRIEREQAEKKKREEEEQEERRKREQEEIQAKKDEERRKREQEEIEAKKKEEQAKRKEDSDQRPDIDQECQKLEVKLAQSRVANGKRQYVTLSETPISDKPYVTQAWTPNSKNPQIRIPLKKIERRGEYPEELDCYNSHTNNILRYAENMFRLVDSFQHKAVIEVSECRTQLVITCTNPFKNARLRQIQMKAFIGVIDNIIECPAYN